MVDVWVEKVGDEGRAMEKNKRIRWDNPLSIPCISPPTNGHLSEEIHLRNEMELN